MLSFRDLVKSFLSLKLGPVPVIVHASLSAFGPVKGGADTVVGALMASFSGVIMPTFTYKTMVLPEVGPPNNAITYSAGQQANLMAEFFKQDMPADSLMGIIAETLRQHPRAIRSNHPIYSFAGVNADAAIKAQDLSNPFGPIESLAACGGWVLLLGVDHTSNTSIHYAEQVAGRRQFVRWSLTPQGIIECPHWPSCSNGFNQATPHLSSVSKFTRAGKARVQAVPLKNLVDIISRMIAQDPLALLCNDPGCERCNAVRKDQNSGGQ